MCYTTGTPLLPHSCPCLCPLHLHAQPHHIAAALQAEKLVLMTDVPGVLHNRHFPPASLPSFPCLCLSLNPHPRPHQIAAALQAEKLVLMTDVPGVLHNKDDPSSLYSSLDIRKARTLIEEGIIAGGMIPKVGAGTGCAETGSCMMLAFTCE